MSLPLVVFVVFLTLKLTSVITWSWWWVTAPLWGPAALSLSIIILAMILIMIGVDNELTKLLKKHFRR